MPLAERNIPVVVHIILGLPGESRETVLRTIDYLNRLPIQGVKLQLLHVLSDSDLADLYRAGEYTPLEKEEYLTLVGDCIAHLRADIVLHRLTGDGDKNTLLAPSGRSENGMSSIICTVSQGKPYPTGNVLQNRPLCYLQQTKRCAMIRDNDFI